MKFIGSDMYDENIYYFCLIIFIKVGWWFVVIIVNNVNLWYNVF